MTIVSPANNATLTASVVNFAWTPAPGATRSYDFRVFNNATGVLELKLNITGGLTSQVYTFKTGSYRIQMRDCNPGCGGAVISNFSVALTPIPSTAPNNLGCTVVNNSGQNRLDCSWSPVTGADFSFFNVVQAGTGPGGGALTVAGTQVGGTSVSLPAPNGTLDVIVKACNGDGCGPFSGSARITTTFGNSAVPVLAEPFNGSVVDAGAGVPVVVFTWSRVAGDNGTNTKYRLYVQDFSRDAAAVDVLTLNNFYGAFLNPGTRYDALVIAIPVSGGSPSQGPSQGFVVKGRIPNAPSFVGPTLFSTVAPGVTRLGWTPVPLANGDIQGRLYQYFLNGPSPSTGVTSEMAVNVTLGAGAYSGLVRVCTIGTSCAAGSDTGWGPFSGTVTAEGGPSSFTVQ